MRINFFGGSGSGKSTLNAWLFSELKSHNMQVEHVSEWIKIWAYEGKRKKSFDEVYVFAKQLRREDVLFQNGVEHIVTDSPIFLQIFYSDLVGHCTVPAQLQMAWEFEKKFPSCNILLSREGVPFRSEGRYEKSVDEATLLDVKLEAFLKRIGLPYTKIPTMDREAIKEHVEKALFPIELGWIRKPAKSKRTARRSKSL